MLSGVESHGGGRSTSAFPGRSRDGVLVAARQYERAAVVDGPCVGGALVACYGESSCFLVAYVFFRITRVAGEPSVLGGLHHEYRLVKEAT
jgi:hypothetical protein